VSVGEGSVQDVDGWRPLDIAMIGQKGLPATYGGIEHHVEELGARLAARGHRVRVYCRDSYDEDAAGRGETYRGMTLHRAPTIGTKHLDAIVHSATSTVMALAARSDVVHYHALGPGLCAPLPRYLSRAGVVLTVHGLDHQRAKWGRAAQTVLGTAHWMSGRVPNRTVVVSQTLREHYAQEFGRDATYIPNGVDQPAAESFTSEQHLAPFGLQPYSYALFVGRLVPEKAVDQLLEAYAKVPGDRRLVVVGDSSFTDDFTERLRQLGARDPRVLFTGFTFGDALDALYRYAGAFVQPSLLEGLPLTLLEAASYGVPVVASDIPPHLEVLGRESGPGRRIVPVGNRAALAAGIATALGVEAPDPASAQAAERAGAGLLRSEVLAGYSWAAATEQLERVYLDVARPARSRRTARASTHGTVGGAGRPLPEGSHS
jgi:glycosyltransferase involved in cell wall biosynthesis